MIITAAAVYRQLARLEQHAAAAGTTNLPATRTERARLARHLARLTQNGRPRP